MSAGTLAILLLVLFSPFGCQSANVNDLSNEDLIRSVTEHEYVLVLFYGDQWTAKHNTVLAAFVKAGTATEELFQKKILLVKNKGHFVAESYGIHRYPSVMFYRNAHPVLYPESSYSADEIAAWMERNHELSTKRLKDDNFEHDTQAASGATTGDWFVMFFSGKCNKLLPTWEAVAGNLKGKVNVATVDFDRNLGLSNRFSIKECPTIMLFRHGKMYQYDLPEPIDYHKLSSYATGLYKNSKAVKVPEEPTPFDQLTDKIADEIKDRLEGPHGTIYMIIGGVLIVTVLIIVFVCFISLRRPDVKKIL